MKKKKELTVLEAVDTLSNLAELDVKIQTEGEELAKKDAWLDPSHTEENKETIRQSLMAVHSYLKEIYDKDTQELKDVDVQRGVQAIMTIVGEAGQKLDTMTKVFRGIHGKQGSITDLAEYKQLQQFYLTKIMKKFEKAIHEEEEWQKEWGAAVEENLLDIHKRGLKDLETVKKDRDYELFFLKKEDGRPFFNPNLIRHIKLVGDLDEMLVDVQGEDPFLKIRTVHDKDLHISAKEILRLATPYIDEFYKEAMHYKEKPFVSNLNKSLMALMLCANPRNLSQNTLGKTALYYYSDFHYYLREALASDEYQKYVSLPIEKQEPFFHALINLSHMLCCFFFLRVGSRQECIDMIRGLVRKKPEADSKKVLVQSYLSLWNNLLEEDERMRDLLKRYPNGPLFKTLDAIRDQAVQRGYDPLNEQNLPCQIYTIVYKELHVSALRLPSPTKQFLIHQAQIVEEFQGFLRSFPQTSKKHLLINLQDRTSWQEHARSIVLEDLQKQAEFRASIMVISIPKSTEFYYQTGSYLNLNQASSFKKQLKEQVESGPACGFYFPQTISEKEINSFSDECIEKIHKHLYGERKQLSRTERMDFIELFYQFLFLKIVFMIHPDTLSFTSKDSIDSGMATSAGFFCFMHIFTNPEQWTANEVDFLIWMLYGPALLVRERLIDPQELHRMVSAISYLHAEFSKNRDAIQDAFASLFEKKCFEKMKIQKVDTL